MKALMLAALLLGSCVTRATRAARDMGSGFYWDPRCRLDGDG